MMIYITHEGKKVLLTLTDEQIQEILTQTQKPKTGWERVEEGESYWAYNGKASVIIGEKNVNYDDDRFSHANYFSDDSFAQDIIRAQELQRKLWRRSAELCEKVDWNDNRCSKFSIYYDCDRQLLFVQALYMINGFGHVYFDTKEHAKQVMDEFHDELIWYFTEFKSRMD